jgi:uncharacterized protein (DUF433 family)
MSREEILGGYPTLTPEGLDAALVFVSKQFQGEEFRIFGERQ